MSKSFTALGLMSGTSLDGIDAAIIQTDGKAKVDGQHVTGYRPYLEHERTMLLGAIAEAKELYDEVLSGQADEVTVASEFAHHMRSKLQIQLRDVQDFIVKAHGEAAKDLLDHHHLTPLDIDVIGMHGQTVLHRPHHQLTLQLGEGQALADLLDIPVVHDFRSADMEAGGQGAPLVPIYHQALALAAHLELPVALVNVGGVANVTYIGPTIEGASEGGSRNDLIAFDTGPGNALLNDWVSRHGAGDMDEGGRIAAKGCVKESVLAALLANPYFSQDPPKSLDRNHFSLRALDGMSLEWGAMTLTSFTALAVSRADFFFPEPPKMWVVCGGGVHNPTLMAEFKKRLSGAVVTADELGWSSDYMEAEAFAYLAVRTLKSLPLTFPGTTGVVSPIKGGIVSKANRKGL